MRCLLSAAILFATASSLLAATYHVSVDGQDNERRDGRSPETAWASLAYACDQVPAGEHTIQLGSGTFVASRTAYVKSGVQISGQGATGETATQIVAGKNWKLTDNVSKEDPLDEYLIVLKATEGTSVSRLALASDPEHRITGGIRVQGGKQISLSHLDIREFRWAGMNLQHAHHLDVHHNTIHNASTDKSRWHNGLIRSRWIKHSQIHHNKVTSDVGGGYGYKGGGHEGVRIHHNTFRVAGGFSIESAHENEYGVEIDRNICNRCISVPKGGQGADPNDRDFEYSFWIHHNLLLDSYTIEGPRNHLRVSHNYIRIERPNGRVYTHHGGKNHGPIWIHHNVVENVDRAFIWMNEGLAENIYVYNNTVFCSDAGERTGSILGAYRADRLNNWVVKNNIFVAPEGKPRKLMDDKREVPTKITATGNLCINITGAPDGNFDKQPLAINAKGDKPWPYFAPASEESFLVDRGEGVSLGVALPFQGESPDLGVFEWGDDSLPWDLPRIDE